MNEQNGDTLWQEKYGHRPGIVFHLKDAHSPKLWGHEFGQL